MTAPLSETGHKRVFLFLQGPSSPIFAKCADRLEAAGHACHRINLNLGDRIFWRRHGAHDYRGTPETWPTYVDDFFQTNGVTDLILLGEERPYHKAATRAARKAGIDVYVVEMGYLRPDWVTFERDGMSSNSHFPKDPQQILFAAQGLPAPDWTPRFSQTFIADAGSDLLYNLPNVFFWFLYPHYKRHALFHPLAEYWGWIRRLTRRKSLDKVAQAIVGDLVEGGQPYFIYPLQLQTDYQLRAHSPFDGQQQAISKVLASFARNAAQDHRLLVKVHPLDNGLIDWKAHLDTEASRLGLAGRIDFIDGGNLDRLIDHASGMVTVNSTAAITAIRRNLPVKTMGSAIFDRPGLSHTGSLDTFWTSATPPDPEVADAFFRLLAHDYQVRGNFYSDAGSTAAAEAIAERLLRAG